LHVPSPTSLSRKRHRVAAAAATLLATTGLALASAAPSQAAGSYIDLSCAPGAGISDAYGGWGVGGGASGAGVFSADQCAGGGGLHTELNPTSGNTVSAYQTRGWVFDAPANTRVAGLTANLGGWARASDGTSRGVVTVDFSQSGRAALLTASDNFWPTTLPLNVWGANDTSISVMAGCDGSSCSNSTAWFSLYAPSVLLSDDTPPTAGATSGAAKDDTTWKGTKNLAYGATDVGGGVAAFRLYVDGVQQTEHIIDTFGGHCNVLASDSGKWTFGYPKPCPAGVNDTEAINTLAIADGQHTIKATVLDAGQREATLYTATKLIANHPPVNTQVPKYDVVSDTLNPRVGIAVVARNDGAWSGPSLTVTRSWVQCDANGALDSCAAIPGATALSYTPTVADVGHRLRLLVTATNAADSVTVYSDPTGIVTNPSNAETTAPKPDANAGSNGANGKDGSSSSTTTLTAPALPVGEVNSTVTHTFRGRVVGEASGAVCPQDKATLKFEHIKGGQLKVTNGKAATAQVQLTCSATGKAIAGAQLDIATKVGAKAAVAADISTDGAGHAVLRLAKGASRAVTVGYRMYADDPIARATTTLKVLVNSKVLLKASRKRVHNGQAVTLRGTLAGGEIPKRGVSLAVQWKDGKRWRPFAQIKTDRKGTFKYAYKFTRTHKKVTYALRVQVVKGQVDYPYVATASKTVKVTVAP
jgi:hypothetical protein